MNSNFKVFSGTKTRYLAEKICDNLGCKLGDVSITYFSDGEFEVCYEESIRGCDVFLVQSTFPSTDNLMELLLMVDAAKRASARTVNAVVPYYGWARQDRKSKPRVSIGAKLVANMLGVAGIDRVITMDLHADQEQGFFEVPVDHLFASTILLPYVKNLNLKNICIATPDVGGSKRASTYAKYLDCPMVICNKTRKRANEVDSMDVIGDVKDMDVVLVDDMVDTAGTITKAADLIKSKGARSVRALASHCIMSGPADERVENSQLEEMVFTDSIPYTGSCSKVKQLSVGALFAETIRRVLENERRVCAVPMEIGPRNALTRHCVIAYRECIHASPSISLFSKLFLLTEFACVGNSSTLFGHCCLVLSSRLHFSSSQSNVDGLATCLISSASKIPSINSHRRH